MSKAKFEAARQLIGEKRYDEARALLQTIDHPRAREWLTQLNKRIPPQRKGRRTYLWGAIAFVVVVLIAIAVLRIAQVTGDAHNAQATRNQEILRSVELTQQARPTADTRPTLPPTWTLTGVPSPQATQTLSASGSCPSMSWWDEAGPVTVTFLDIAETASQTARMSLSGLVLDLRSTYREFERIEHPNCVDQVRRHLNRGMELAIDGFNDFLGQDEGLASIDLGMATEYFACAWDELLKLGLMGDVRMGNTAVFIWGGDEPGTVSYYDDLC